LEKECDGFKTSEDEHKHYRPQEDQLDLDKVVAKSQSAAQAHLPVESK